MTLHQIKEILHKLSQDKYPLFVSEADLQFRFTLKAKELFPNLLFYLEYPEKIKTKTKHYDLVCVDKHKKEYSIIEFKYKTSKEIISIFGINNFELKPQGASDLGKYDCYRDINRLENQNLNSNYINSDNYLILITNDSKYWHKATKHKCVDEQFNMCDGFIESGTHKLNGKNDKTRPMLTLRKQYTVKWEQYFGNFRQLVIVVK